MNIDSDMAFKIAQALALVGGGLFFLFKMGRVVGKVEEALNIQNLILKNQAEDVTELKADVQRFGDVLTTIAVQENRLDRLEADMQDLKHGRGFVTEKS